MYAWLPCNQQRKPKKHPRSSTTTAKYCCSYILLLLLILDSGCLRSPAAQQSSGLWGICAGKPDTRNGDLVTENCLANPQTLYYLCSVANPDLGWQNPERQKRKCGWQTSQIKRSCWIPLVGKSQMSDPIPKRRSWLAKRPKTAKGKRRRFWLVNPQPFNRNLAFCLERRLANL